MNIVRLLIGTAMIFSAAAIAQEEWRQALPGEPLYEAKQRIETAELNAAVDPLERAEVHTRHAERRLQEIQALADQGRLEHIDDLSNRYAGSMNDAGSEVDRARGEGRDVSPALHNVERATARHSEVLIGVYGRVPQQARPAIERAMESSQRGRQNAKRQLQTERPAAPQARDRQPDRPSRDATGRRGIEREDFGRGRPGDFGGGRPSGSAGSGPPAGGPPGSGRPGR